MTETPEDRLAEYIEDFIPTDAFMTREKARAALADLTDQLAAAREETRKARLRSGEDSMYFDELQQVIAKQRDQLAVKDRELVEAREALARWGALAGRYGSIDEIAARLSPPLPEQPRTVKRIVDRKIVEAPLPEQPATCPTCWRPTRTGDLEAGGWDCTDPWHSAAPEPG